MKARLFCQTKNCKIIQKGGEAQTLAINLSISSLAVLGYERVRTDTLKQRASEPFITLTDEVLQSSSLLAKPSPTSPPSSLKEYNIKHSLRNR